MMRIAKMAIKMAATIGKAKMKKDAQWY